MIKNEITVIVAEDEPIILNNAVKKIEAVAAHIKVIGKAGSGRETLELLTKKLPDILVTDIEMPCMNGLELIREVRRLYPQIHILILSGYSNFEYARTALQHGVDDYLLKPVSSQNLTAVLLKTIDSIQKEKQQYERDILSKTLKGSLSDEVNPSSFPDGHFLLIFVTIGNAMSCQTDLSNVRDIHLIWQEIDFHNFLSVGSFDHIWIIDENCPLQKFIILHTISGRVHTTQTAVRLLEHICSVKSDLPCCIMLNEKLIPYSSIGESAQKMRLAFPSYAGTFKQEYILYPSADAGKTQEPKKKKEQYDILCQMNNSASFLQYITKNLVYFMENGYSLNTVNGFYTDIFHMLPLLFKLPEDVCLQVKTKILQEAYVDSGFSETVARVRQELIDLLECHSVNTGIDNMCKKLKEYLIQNYNYHITMDDLSDKYGYTASYINRLFKKEYGISPLQYQTALRIEKAKELLKSHSGFDIKIIAASIGYDDARYFSRVFKNETGMTPSEWLSAPANPSDT